MSLSTNKAVEYKSVNDALAEVIQDEVFCKLSEENKQEVLKLVRFACMEAIYSYKKQVAEFLGVDE